MARTWKFPRGRQVAKMRTISVLLCVEAEMALMLGIVLTRVSTDTPGFNF